MRLERLNAPDTHNTTTNTTTTDRTSMTHHTKSFNTTPNNRSAAPTPYAATPDSRSGAATPGPCSHVRSMQHAPPNPKAQPRAMKARASLSGSGTPFVASEASSPQQAPAVPPRAVTPVLSAGSPAAAALLGFRFRHEPYAAKKHWGKASAGRALVRGSMPPASALAATGNTPQPEDYLPSCVFVSNSDLAAAARAVAEFDREFVSAVAEGRAAAAKVVVGQTGYTACELVHRGVVVLLCPGVPMSAPTVHNSRGRQGHRTHTGLLHASLPRPAVAAVQAAVHQRAYYDIDGVWLARTAEAARELAVFELVMAHYFNGVRTGRPMAPVTMELARSEALLAQRVA